MHTHTGAHTHTNAHTCAPTLPSYRPAVLPLRCRRGAAGARPSPLSAACVCFHSHQHHAPPLCLPASLPVQLPSRLFQLLSVVSAVLTALSLLLCTPPVVEPLQASAASWPSWLPGERRMCVHIIASDSSQVRKVCPPGCLAGRVCPPGSARWVAWPGLQWLAAWRPCPTSTPTSTCPAQPSTQVAFYAARGTALSVLTPTHHADSSLVPPRFSSSAPHTLPCCGVPSFRPPASDTCQFCLPLPSVLMPLWQPWNHCAFGLFTAT